MKYKKLINHTAAIILGCLSTQVFSNPLVITNNTDHDSACRIVRTYSKKCTDTVPNGVTPAGAQNHVIEEGNIRMACFPKKDHETCEALVYMDAHCAGPEIASVKFSIKDGVSDLTPTPNSGYSIIVKDGFNVVINKTSSIAIK